MTSLFLAAALAVAPDEPVKLAAPGFSTVEVKPELAIFLNDHFAQQLEAQGLRVVTAKEIGDLLGLERQKAMLGCSDNSACSVELAGALGVDALISGSLAHLGSTWKVSLKIVSAATGKPLASFADQASSEEQLVELFSKAAPVMATDVLTALNRKAVQVAGGVRKASWGPLKKASIVSGSVGVGALGTGIALLFLAKANYDGLTLRPRTDIGDPAVVASNGKRQQLAGWVLLGTGVAGLAGAVVLWLLDGRAPVDVAFVPTSGGGLFALSGVWP